MNAGPSQPMSTSKLVLIASIVYTLAAYVTFTGLWGIVIDPRLLLVVIGVQLAMLQLGGTRVLTGLGAAYLAALLAVAALFAAVFLLFPASNLYRSAASASGAVTVFFILFSFFTASREPISASEEAPSSGDANVLFDDEESDDQGEIKDDGESADAKAMADKGDEPEEPEDLFADEAPVQVESVQEEAPALPEEPVTEYEFDGLSDEKLELSLEGRSGESVEGSPASVGEAPSLELPLEPPELEELDIPVAPLAAEDNLPSGRGEPDQPEHPDTIIPDDSVEEVAREISWSETQSQTQSQTETETGAEEPPTELEVRFDEIVQPEESAAITESDTPRAEPDQAAGKIAPEPEEEPSPPAYPKEYKMRTHYRVLDSWSGELYGVYYGDEGYASLDLVSLGALLGEKMGSAEISIVKLDWSNFDEVEVHVQKPMTVEPESIDQPPADETGGSRDVASPESGYPWEVPGQVVGDVQEEVPAEDGRELPRYVIYDRRTIQPMKEYVPEGDRPRIDRLTLYKLFPEYDFKTFEIDSIRWQEDEVRIFIRGEKKQSPKSKVQNPKGTDD